MANHINWHQFFIEIEQEEAAFCLKESITRKRIAQGLNPRQRKWQDTRSARRQLFSHYPGHDSRPPHEVWRGLTQSGVPYYIRFINRPEGRRNLPNWYAPWGFHRPQSVRAERRMNGRVEWMGEGDAWSKPAVEGKSSRQRQRQQEQWWEEACATLSECD